MRVDFANVVDVIVVDKILLIHIFGSRTVAAQKNASATNVLDVIARDSVFLTI